MHTQQPSVSVVIPVRNRPGVIHRAIDSAIAQSYPIAEIIVVDDGSTDSTPESVEARRDPITVRVIRRMASDGAPSARNEGARVATGDLLAFLDSDDAWEADKIAQQVALLHVMPESPAIFTNIRRIRDGVVAERTAVPERTNIQELYRDNILGGCSTALIRRDAFVHVGGFRPGLPSCQDWDLWLRLADLGPLGCCEAPLTRYYFDGSDRISSNTSRVLAGHKLIMDDIYRRVQPEEARRLARLHKHYLSEVAFFSLNDENLGRELAWHAMRDPADIRSFARSAKLWVLYHPVTKRLRGFGRL